ncbi:SnoaL-like polyketide cyclase [Arenibacter sp. N53]|uniref:ester cyclase n=1 Tax=Arenibacter TaxID=178469 RepID=UPI000CD47058|nr:MULTISPECIES: ester cyclase [Arenibacter]MCM4151125.1 SnoaL-like polyketide cyclase [Arenibacter sp. N53]
MKKQQQPSSKIRPDQLVLELFDRVWHHPHELEAIDELMTEDYAITTGGNKIQGRDKFKEWIKAFQKLLLDAKTESVDIFFDKAESKVVSRWVCSGLNNGLFGLKPDLKSISFTGIAIWKVEGNRLSECWVERSSYELYRKLINESEEAKFV